MFATKDHRHNVGHRGAVHVELTGAANAFRYRPPRLEAAELASILTCELVLDGNVIGPLGVLDVSPTGLGVALTTAVLLPIGTVIDEVRLVHRQTVVAREKAVVVNMLPGSPKRLGLRLLSGLFDLGALQLRDTAAIGSFLDELVRKGAERERLPTTWRAAVADLAHLLGRTRDFFSQLERSLDGRQPDEHEQSLFAELFDTWGPQYHAMLRDLHAQTQAFDEDTHQQGLDYAAQILLPLVYAGPIHRRAYDKPQGYAGDYELMRLFFAQHMDGDDLYARFLHYVGQRYPMARTVVARERVMRQVVQRRIDEGDPVRILSLACGPALELENLLRTCGGIGHHVELFLLDQDEDALAHAHRSLVRTLADRGAALSGVELSALHFSVMQLLRPRGEAEAAVGRQILDRQDLIYSAGLFDYLARPVAILLLRRLMAMLRPGGELFIGNLRCDPASAWMMEHAVAWHLVYREPHEMLELASKLDDAAETEIVYDETERCMFLRVRKAAG